MYRNIKAIANRDRQLGILTEPDKYNDVISKECDTKEKALVLINDNVKNSMIDLSSLILKSRENIVYSPVALYMALAVLAKMTDGSSRKQLLKLLNVKERELDDIYLAVKNIAVSKCGLATSVIASSVWLNENMNYNNAFFQKLFEELDIDSFAGTMGSLDMNNAIAEWVNAGTKDLLKDNVNISTDETTLLEFLTTIYFSAKWSKAFNCENTKSDDFYMENGKKIKCDYMYQKVTAQYYRGKNFVAITKGLSGEYQAVFVLPDEGTVIEDVLEAEKVWQLMTTGDSDGGETMDVHLSLPKYDKTSKVDLKSFMKELGITEVFNSGAADFTLISNMKELFVSKAEQTTRFVVDEEGVEAASCVEFGIAFACISPHYEEIEVKLNRPFLYAVVSKNAVPLFAGRVDRP